MVKPIALIQPVDYTAPPGTLGITPERHRSCAEYVRQLQADYPGVQFMLDRAFGVGPMWTVGNSPGGIAVECGVYGPEHCDWARAEPMEGKQPSRWIAELWTPLRPWGWYLGLPPVGASVTSKTEAKDFLYPCGTHGSVVLLDVLTECDGPSPLVEHCYDQSIPVIGEPNGYPSLPWSKHLKLSGQVCELSRANLMAAGDPQFAYHPKGNYVRIDGSTKPDERVTAAMVLRAKGVRAIVETGGMTKAQKDALFSAPVLSNDPAAGDAA